jgi:hypothetical protein
MYLQKLGKNIIIFGVLKIIKEKTMIVFFCLRSRPHIKFSGKYLGTLEKVPDKVFVF